MVFQACARATSCSQEINLRLQRGEITAEDIAQVQEDDFSEEEPETGRDSWDDAEDSDADYVCSNAIQGFMAERIQKAFRAWKFRASVKLIRVFDIPKVGTLRWLIASKAVLLIQHAFREYCCHQYNIAVQDAQMTELMGNETLPSCYENPEGRIDTQYDVGSIM